MLVFVLLGILLAAALYNTSLRQRLSNLKKFGTEDVYWVTISKIDGPIVFGNQDLARMRETEELGFDFIVRLQLTYKLWSMTTTSTFNVRVRTEKRRLILSFNEILDFKHITIATELTLEGLTDLLAAKDKIGTGSLLSDRLPRVAVSGADISLIASKETRLYGAALRPTDFRIPAWHRLSYRYRYLECVAAGSVITIMLTRINPEGISHDSAVWLINELNSLKLV